MWQAAVAQPFRRDTALPPPGEIDEEAGEFWVPNPWGFGANSPYNLSGFERNRTFWNVTGHEFMDLSYISGLDSDADSRGFVAADITGDGMPEIFLRSAGGGPLRIFRNQMPKQHYLRVSLRGVQSNRFGVGSKLVARAGDRSVVRELYPMNCFQGQSPPEVVIGLGDADTVDELTIRWPTGERQVLKSLAADRHVLITEGDDTPQTVIAGTRTPPSANRSRPLDPEHVDARP